jgi:hypothetical protein
MEVKDEGEWLDFRTGAPELAETGERLFFQGSEVAAAFLATVAPDRGPRVHPVFPVLALENLWLSIVNMSPKYPDLKRNEWFALHSLPTVGAGEEFYVRGHATEIVDLKMKKRVVRAVEGRQGSSDFEALFQCTLRSVLYTRWDHWGTEKAWPSYSKWEAVAEK